MILGLIEASRVYFASDTMISTGDGVWHRKIKTWIHPNNENVLIGAEGDPLFIQFVKYNNPFLSEFPDEESVTEWLFSVLKIYEQYQNSNFPTSFLLGGNAKLVVANIEGLVTEVKEFEAIGEGREVAVSVLNVNRQTENVEERISQALWSAVKLYPGVGGNVDIQMI